MSASVETIAALATAPLPAGVAVVRLSGPRSAKILRECFAAPSDPVAEPRKLVYGSFVDPDTGRQLDKCLAVYMPGPNSYTGEDIVEFQIHGSPLLARKVLGHLFALGCSPAEAGEFTKRAFLNGKIDLAQAEAVADLIEASSERALQVAGEQLSGRLSSALEKVGEPLRDVLAELEASLDFPEEDIDPKVIESFENQFRAAHENLRGFLESYDGGSVLKEGFRVLLCGPPNAGKSSLLNLMLDKPRAIVSEISGTTRDLIEESCIINDFHFVFCDSAGITETDDQIENTGIELALDRLDWADLVLLVVDADDDSRSWEPVLEQIKGRAKQIWMIINKIDLNSAAIGQLYCESDICRRNLYISVETGDGTKQLKEALVEEIKSSLPSFGEASLVLTHERHRDALRQSLEGLEDAGSALRLEQPLEVVSAALRGALNKLDEIIGKTYTEDILGRIFSKFCIGK